MTAIKICCAIFFLVTSLHLSEQRKCFQCSTEDFPIRDLTAMCGDFSTENSEIVTDCGDGPCVKAHVSGSQGDVQVSKAMYQCGLADSDVCKSLEDQVPPGFDVDCISCDDSDYCNHNSTPPTSSPPPNSGVTMTTQWMAFTLLFTLVRHF